MRHAVLLLLLIAPAVAFGHGGGLDALGCHNDRRASQYHCHRGDLAGQTYRSKADAQAAVSGTSTSAPDDGGSGATSGAGVPYDRDLYGGWIDEDGDCQDTRQEVLIAESLEPVTLDNRGCRVVSGRWYDPYTDSYFADPGELDIDHFVPLREVH